MKAIRIVHPDKQNFMTDHDTKYIANRVFNALNDAYKEFQV